MDDKGKQSGGGRRTPGPGVPVRPVPPVRIEAHDHREDETPVVSIVSRSRTAAAPSSPGSPDVGVSPAERDDTVDRLAAAILSRMARLPGEGDGDGGKKRPTERTEWLRWWLGILIPFAIAAAAWFLGVRDALHDRPTQADVVRMMAEGINLHETRGEHPKLEQRLDGIEAKQGAMRDEQLHQGDQLDTITRSLGTIEKRLNR